MTLRNLDKLFSPASVAVFGASLRPGSIGATVWRNLRQGGFAGPIWPVNPKHADLNGTPVYPSCQHLPGAPDLALLCTPPHTIVPLIEELGALGTRAVVVYADALDAAQRQAALQASRPHILRLLGPGGIGLLRPAAGLNASAAHCSALSGELAFVSHSGALVAAMLDWARGRGIGFSTVVSLGRQADVDFGDMLDYLASDAKTRAILLYIESITAPRKFMSAARAAARNKPVIVVKAGRFGQGQRAASARTGAPASSDFVYDAAIRRAGMLRVDTLQELFDAAQALARLQPNCSESLTVVTNAGGAAVLAADAAARHGVTFAALGPGLMQKLNAALPPNWSRANPVDIGDDAPPARYVETMASLLADPAAGTLLLLQAPSAAVASEDIARAVLPQLHEARARVMTCWLGDAAVARASDLAHESGLASYATPEDAVRAFALQQTYRRNQEALMQTPEASTLARCGQAEATRIIGAARDAGMQWLGDAQARALLGAYGVPVATGRSVDTEAAAALAQRSHARDVVVGASVDPVFGPVIHCHDAAALPPLNRTLARDLVERAGLSRLLGPGRDRPPANTEALHDVLVAISAMLAELPMLAQLEIDPLRVDEHGALAIDVRIRLAPGSPGGIERFAILPYPSEWVRTVDWHGRAVTLRPIRPEDEPQHARFLERATPEDMRMRFFCARHTPAHSELARLTQIDYDREMAFVVQATDAQGQPETLAVGRTVADPDGAQAEFALMVRSDIKGRGLGRMLLAELIEHARARGIGRLVGFVLPENTAMLRLARQMGFVDETDACTDADSRRVVLRLRPNEGTEFQGAGRLSAPA